MNHATNIEDAILDAANMAAAIVLGWALGLEPGTVRQIRGEG